MTLEMENDSPQLTSENDSEEESAMPAAHAWPETEHLEDDKNEALEVLELEQLEEEVDDGSDLRGCEPGEDRSAVGGAHPGQESLRAGAHATREQPSEDPGGLLRIRHTRGLDPHAGEASRSP